MIVRGDGRRREGARATTGGTWVLVSWDQVLGVRVEETVDLWLPPVAIEFAPTQATWLGRLGVQPL
jgi:hypothetical protein